MNADSHYTPRTWLLYDYHSWHAKRNNCTTTHEWLHSHRMHYRITMKRTNACRKLMSTWTTTNDNQPRTMTGPLISRPVVILESSRSHSFVIPERHNQIFHATGDAPSHHLAWLDHPRQRTQTRHSTHLPSQLMKCQVGKRMRTYFNVRNDWVSVMTGPQ
jgi:hypothetical protein